MTNTTTVPRGRVAEREDTIFRELMELVQNDPEMHSLRQFRSMVTASQYRRLYALLRRYVAPGSTVLDWGCGNGHFSYGLVRMGYDVDGYSFEDFPLRRELGPDYRFTLATENEPVKLPYPERRFDAVVSVGVLEHVREVGGSESGSLGEIARVLKPGGHFLCYHFPNRYSMVEKAMTAFPERHRHIYRYTAGDIRALCRGAGLELVEVRRYGPIPRNIWGALPAPLGGWNPLARAYDALDGALGKVLSPWCQNYLFVARRPRG